MDILTELFSLKQNKKGETASVFSLLFGQKGNDI